jgi:hypothetical protein
MMRRALAATLVVASSLVSKAASAEPLVWGSGSWGDTWQGGNPVPALSPPGLALLAVALVVVVAIALRRRPGFPRS